MLSPIDYKFTTSTGFMFSVKEGLVEHLNVEHPAPLLNYIKQLPKLHSVAFEFRKSAFGKSGINQEAQLMELLENTSLTRLSITGSKKIKSFPESIKKHPLRFLKISSCPNITDIRLLLAALPTLEHLELDGEFVDIGVEFPFLPKLKYFKSGAKEISSLVGISKCKAIEGLDFRGLEDTQLPEEISNLAMLKNVMITHCPNLTTLPNLRNVDKLEKLTLNQLPALESINIDFENKKNLALIDFRNLGNKETVFPYPVGLENCLNLSIITFGAVTFPEIPEAFSKFSKLKYLSLYNLKLKPLADNLFENMLELEGLNVRGGDFGDIPSSLSCSKNLERISLEFIPFSESLNIDFEKLLRLQSLKIENWDNLREIDESLSLSQSLENLSLMNLPKLSKLPPIGARNMALKSLNIKVLPELKELPNTLTSLPALNQLAIAATGLKRLPDNIDQLNGLYNIMIDGADFEYFPLSIVNLSTLERVWISRGNSNEKPEVVSIREIFPHLKKLENQALKEAVFFWAGYGFEHLPITNEIKTKTLEALQYSIKNLPLIVLGNIHRFNPGQKPIDINQLKEGDKVWVNGVINGGKTDFKNKLKEVGLKVVNNFTQDVKLVIIGKKPKIPNGLFEGDSLFASQLEFENISKTENPGLLQQEDVPSDFIYNLQQLLWSGDPQNEAVALELVKTNGLPESVEEDFLLSAKICTDKNLRNRIRTFIRGKISQVKQKALSTGSAPFAVEKLNRVLPSDSLARMHFAYYKRTGKLSHDYFRHDSKGEHIFRAEAFAAALPDFVKNEKYLNSYTPLLMSEWNQIFEQDVFKGNLRRIVVQFQNINQVPERLFDHIDSLKDIEVTLREDFKIEGLFKFFKLNKFRISINNLEVFPKGIGQLKRLRNLLIYSTVRVEMQEDLKELDKLNRLMIQNWSNRESFSDFLKTIS